MTLLSTETHSVSYCSDPLTSKYTLGVATHRPHTEVNFTSTFSFRVRNVHAYVHIFIHFSWNSGPEYLHGSIRTMYKNVLSF